VAKKEKHLCQWKKDEITKGFKRLKKIVRAPRFACQNCCRAASKEKYLCEPISLE